MTGDGRIALCVIGRMENRYAREFVEHHLRLGFNKIIVCDNNFGDEEYFEAVLDDYIAYGFVDIVDYRDQLVAQKKSYNECYERYGKDYDWIAFFDFDEFLTIASGEDIHSFMRHYEHADCLVVNYMIYTDNHLVRYDSRPVTERFTEPMQVDRCVTYRFPENKHIKSIVRGGIQGFRFRRNPHIPSEPVMRCVRTNGDSCRQSPFQEIDHSVAYLKHYTTKTIEEWMTCKVRRGFPCSYRLNKEWRSRHLSQFFTINEWTQEKQNIVNAYTKPIRP